MPGAERSKSVFALCHTVCTAVHSEVRGCMRSRQTSCSFRTAASAIDQITMLSCAASQYEQDYLPHRLRNWEVPSEAERKCAVARGASNSAAGVRPHSGRTQFIVDERGYLVGAKRSKSAFNLAPEERLNSAPRWPQVC